MKTTKEDIEAMAALWSNLHFKHFMEMLHRRRSEYVSAIEANFDTNRVMVAKGQYTAITQLTKDIEAAREKMKEFA
jgi:hypothetical protein